MYSIEVACHKYIKQIQEVGFDYLLVSLSFPFSFIVQGAQGLPGSGVGSTRQCFTPGSHASLSRRDQLLMGSSWWYLLSYIQTSCSVVFLASLYEISPWDFCYYVIMSPTLFNFLFCIGEHSNKASFSHGTQWARGIVFSQTLYSSSKVC